MRQDEAAADEVEATGTEAAARRLAAAAMRLAASLAATSFAADRAAAASVGGADGGGSEEDLRTGFFFRAKRGRQPGRGALGGGAWQLIMPGECILHRSCAI